jgi:hypothetical protein
MNLLKEKLLPFALDRPLFAIETLFRAGIDLGPLQGVPVSVKDLMHVQGAGTMAGSRVLLEAPMDQSEADRVSGEGETFSLCGQICQERVNLR